MRARRAGRLVPLTVLALVACAEGRTDVGRGWVEGREVDVAPLTGGRLVAVHVDEGDTVAIGDTIARLSKGSTTAEVDVARGRVAAARARLRELERGTRTQDIAAARASLEGAEAELVRARRELERVEALDARELTSARALDDARAAALSAASRRDVARETLARLRAGATPEQLDAARSDAAAAEAALDAAESVAAELVLLAPAGGPVIVRVFDPGEVVPAGAPVVTILDDDARWLRVWVSQERLGRIGVGSTARARVDGVPDTTFAATVSSIATHAEFTPRVALTEDERADLMFAVRLSVDDPGGMLRVGVPVEVDFEAVP